MFNPGWLPAYPVTQKLNIIRSIPWRFPPRLSGVIGPGCPKLYLDVPSSSEEQEGPLKTQTKPNKDETKGGDRLNSWWKRQEASGHHFVWAWWSKGWWRPRRFLWGSSGRADWLAGWGSCWSLPYSRAGSGTGPGYWRWRSRHTEGRTPGGRRRHERLMQQNGCC